MANTDGKDYEVPNLVSYKYHAFVTHATEDRDFAEDLTSQLEKTGFTVLLASRDFLPGSQIITQMENAVAESRRTILVLSPNYLESKFCEYEAMMASTSSIAKGEANLLVPIIYKMTKQEIPERFKWLNYLDPEEKAHYWRRLCKALSDPAVHIKSAMPVLHVAQGLAWSYFYGYLNFLLKGHTERVEKWRKSAPEGTERLISRKLFILIPESCYCYPTFNDADSAISSAGNLEKFTHARAGNKARDYTTPINKIEDPEGEDYYFVGEYATPILSIYEMAEGNLAGLKSEEKSQQVVSFYHTLQNILCHADAKHCHGKFQIFMYKDKGECDSESRYPLAAELRKLIKEEIKKEVGQATKKKSIPTKD